YLGIKLIIGDYLQLNRGVRVCSLHYGLGRMQRLGVNIWPKQFVNFYFDELAYCIYRFTYANNILEIGIICFCRRNKCDTFCCFKSDYTIKRQICPGVEAITMSEEKPSFVILFQKVRMNQKSLFFILVERFVLHA